MLALLADPTGLYCEVYRRFAGRLVDHQSRGRLHDAADVVAETFALEVRSLRTQLVREWLVQDARAAVTETAASVFLASRDEQLQAQDARSVHNILCVLVRSLRGADPHNDDAHADCKELLSLLVESVVAKPRPIRAKLRAVGVLLAFLTDAGRPIAARWFLEAGVPSGCCCCHHRRRHRRHRAASHTQAAWRRLWRSCSRWRCTRSTWRCSTSIVPCLLATSTRSSERAARCRWCGSSWMSRLPRRRTRRGATAQRRRCCSTSTSTTRMQRLLLVSVLEPLSARRVAHALTASAFVWRSTMLAPLKELRTRARRDELSCRSTSDSEQWITFSLVMGGHSDASSTTTARDIATATTPDGQSTFAGLPVAQVQSVLDKVVLVLHKCPFLTQVGVPAVETGLRDLVPAAASSCLRTSGIGSGKEPDRLSPIDLEALAVQCAFVIPQASERIEVLQRIIRAGALVPMLDHVHDAVVTRDDHDQRPSQPKDTSVEVLDDPNEPLALVREVFDAAVAQDRYGELLNTPFERSFFRYVAAQGTIDSVLALL